VQALAAGGFMAPEKQIAFELADDLYEAYANNIYYEASSWDLRLIFGQMDQTGGKVKIAQHSSITIPWSLAKLTAYLLQGQIEAHELANGKIDISPRIIPPELEPPSDELKKSDPNAEAVYAIFNRLRKEFLDKLK
jgi:hypothetical protein